MALVEGRKGEERGGGKSRKNGPSKEGGREKRSDGSKEGGGGNKERRQRTRCTYVCTAVHRQ